MRVDLEKTPYLILDDSPEAQLELLHNFVNGVSMKSVADIRKERGKPLEPDEEELRQSREKNRKLIASIHR